MKEPIVIIGIGELAGVFAQGFLRCGHPVYPIIRGMDLSQLATQIPEPKLVLITVQESELANVLEQIPEIWHNKLGLLQNELLPRDWLSHGIQNPTITVVWFEKKKNLPVTPILYSPSYGDNAPLIADALQAMDIPAPILETEEAILYELVRKTVYILTVNIAGLVNNCTVGELWENNQSFATTLAHEIIQVLEYLTEQTLPHDRLIMGMGEGIHDCPGRFCLGRRASQRLERVIKYAQEAKLTTPELTKIYKEKVINSN